MKGVEILYKTVVVLDSERRIDAWLWGFRKYDRTATRRFRGHHGFTVRVGSTLVVVTLPGKGYVS